MQGAIMQGAIMQGAITREVMRHARANEPGLGATAAQRGMMS
jgi:hypothetical protein